MWHIKLAKDSEKSLCARVTAENQLNGYFFFFFHIFICYCMENGSNSVEHINAWAHEHFLKSLSAIMGSETD